MLNSNDISISISCQQFLCTTYQFDEISSQMTLHFKSTQKTSEVRCPVCGAFVYAQDNCSTTLKDAPVFSGIMQHLKVTYHRYQCTGCGHVFTEDLGLLRYPGTRITHRAAMIIKQLLRHRMTISAVSSMTGIRWNTVCQIHRETMQEALKERQKELEKIFNDALELGNGVFYLVFPDAKEKIFSPSSCALIQKPLKLLTAPWRNLTILTRNFLITFLPLLSLMTLSRQSNIFQFIQRDTARR